MYYRRSGDIFGSVLAMLAVAALFAAVAIYVGGIVLAVILSIGIAVGFTYALVIYVRSVIRAVKSAGGVSAPGKFKTLLLKWWTVFKASSVGGFADNFAVSRNAAAKAGAYRWLSFRKWLWIAVAPATLVFGTVILAVIIAVQLVLFCVLIAAALALIAAFCALMLVTAIVYAFVAMFVNLGSALKGCTPIYKTFDFTLGATVRTFALSVPTYFKAMWSYMKGVWCENLAVGTSNVAMASGYKVFSLPRYFLLTSIVALLLVAILAGAVIAVVMIALFPVFFIADFLWALIATVIRLF